MQSRPKERKIFSRTMELVKGNVMNFIAEPAKDEYWVQILSLMKFYQWLIRKANKSTSLSDVIAKVCAHFHISEEMLKAAGKARPMTEARAVVAAIVQIAPHLRLTELAKLLRRDISSLGKAAQRIAGDVNTRRLVSELVDDMRTEGYKCPKL